MFYRCIFLKEYVQGQNFLTSGSLQGVLNDHQEAWMVKECAGLLVLCERMCLVPEHGQMSCLLFKL